MVVDSDLKLKSSFTRFISQYSNLIKKLTKHFLAKAREPVRKKRKEQGEENGVCHNLR